MADTGGALSDIDSVSSRGERREAPGEDRAIATGGEVAAAALAAWHRARQHSAGFAGGTSIADVYEEAMGRTRSVRSRPGVGTGPPSLVVSGCTTSQSDDGSHHGADGDTRSQGSGRLSGQPSGGGLHAAPAGAENPGRVLFSSSFKQPGSGHSDQQDALDNRSRASSFEGGDNTGPRSASPPRDSHPTSRRGSVKSPHPKRSPSPSPPPGSRSSSSNRRPLLHDDKAGLRPADDPQKQPSSQEPRLSGRRWGRDQRSLLVLEVFQSGKIEYREMRRNDISRYVKTVNDRVYSPGLEPFGRQESPAGVDGAALGRQTTPQPTPHGNKTRRTILHPRDIRKLDLTLNESTDPAVLVRRQVILLKIDPFRALILRDRFLLILPEGADGMLEGIFSRLQHAAVEGGVGTSANTGTSAGPRAAAAGAPGAATTTAAAASGTTTGTTTAATTGTTATAATTGTTATGTTTGTTATGTAGHQHVAPFEFLAVEALLEGLVQVLTKEYNNVAQKAVNVSAMSHGSVSQALLENMRGTKSAADALASRLIRIKAAISVVLDDDNDLYLMNLSALWDHSERHNQVEFEQFCAEPELLLESYLQEVNSLLTQVLLTQKKILNTEAGLMLQLDTARNKLLLYSIVFAVLSMCTSAVSMVAGIFGMNLTNSHETDSGWFTSVTGITLGVVGAGFFATMLILYREGAFWV